MYRPSVNEDVSANRKLKKSTRFDVVHTRVLDGSLRNAVETVGGELFTIVHKPQVAGGSWHACLD
jgi:hypothetical protein